MPEAYDYYLRALSSFYQFTREQNIETLRLGQAANVIDPEFAAAYAIGAGRNVEVMWLLGRLASDHKTIADFRN